MESLMITQIPNDDSLDSIKIREGIIRDFYREWKEKDSCYATRFNSCRSKESLYSKDQI